MIENHANFDLVITGEAEVVRGPLGQIVDLVTRLQAEGHEVAPEILDVLERLQRPRKDEQ